MFLAFLALLFGGGTFWGLRTEEGRDFFGGLFASIGNFLGEQFPGLRGLMGFLTPGQDPDGEQRETFVRNGNMTLIRQGMQRFAGIPSDVVEALAPSNTPDGGRAAFNEFLQALGPDAVSDISRTPDTATIARNITPATIARAMQNPALATRILNVADRRLASGGAGQPDPNSSAGQVLGAVRSATLSLLLDQQHAATLRQTLTANPRLLEQVRPILARAAGEQGAPFANALTSSPEALLGALAAAREARITPESLLTPEGMAAAITPESLTAILRRPEVAGPLLRAAETAPAAGSGASALTTRLQDAATQLLTNPAQQANLRQILNGNPDILSQIIPAAAAAAARSGRPTGGNLDLPALLSNPALREHLQRPGQVEAVTAALSDAITKHHAGLSLSPDVANFLTRNEAHHTRLLVTLAAEPQGNAFLQEVMPLLASGGQTPDINRLASLVTRHPAQVNRLLQGIDPSALDASNPMRGTLESLRDFAKARTADGRSNLDTVTGALGSLRRPDGTLPPEAGQAVQAMLALRAEGLTDADKARHTTALTRATLGLLAAPGGEAALASLRQLNLANVPGSEQARAALGSLTPEYIAILRHAAPALQAADDTTLTQMNGLLARAGNGELRIEHLLDFAKREKNVATLQRVLTDVPVEAWPAEHRGTIGMARQFLTAPAHTPAGGTAQSNLQVIGDILRHPVTQTAEGRELGTRLRGALGHYANQGTAPSAEDTKGLVRSALALVGRPDAAPVLEQLGRLNLESVPGVGEQARALRVLSAENIPLIQRAFASLNDQQREFLAHNLSQLASGGTLEVDLSMGGILRNPDVQKLVQQLQVDSLPEGQRNAFLALREQMCAPLPASGGIGNWLHRQVHEGIFGPGVREGACTAEPAPQRMSDAGGTHVIPGLSSSISGGTHVGEGTRVHAAATPRVTETPGQQVASSQNVG